MTNQWVSALARAEEPSSPLAFFRADKELSPEPTSAGP